MKLLPFLLVALLCACRAALAAPPSSAIRADKSYTMSAWVKLGHLGGPQTFLRRRGQFSLQTQAGGDKFVFTVTGGDGSQSAATASDFTPTPGVWYHLTGVYDAAAHQIRLYGDGMRLASAPAKLATAVMSNEGRLDASGTGAAQTAAVHFVPRALTDAQIAAQFALERKQFSPNKFTWANPIYYQGNGPGDDVRDPDIIHDGGMYYCVATLFPFRNYTDRDPKLPDDGSSPGITLYESPDLKVWKRKSWLLKSSDLPIDCSYKHQFWAPEIHKFNGRYYLIFGGSNWIADKYNIHGRMGYYQFVGVADKISGPYTHVTAMGGPGVDTSLFQDDDGKTYAVWPRSEIHPVDLSQIDRGIVTVSPKLSQAATDDDFKAIGKPAPNTIEGPYLIKRRGVYYCFFAETYPDLYATGVATARSLSGPWTLDPRWRIFPGGHQALFTGPDGGFWTSFRHENSGTAPWLSIDPVSFDAAGNVQVTPTEGPQSVSLTVRK